MGDKPGACADWQVARGLNSAAAESALRQFCN